MKKKTLLIIILSLIIIPLIAISTLGKGNRKKEKKCDLKKIEKAYWCEKCDNLISVNNKVDICVKTGYACKNCNKESFRKVKCSGCKQEMEKITVKCRVNYKCKSCDYTQDKPGKCQQDKEAKCYGKPLIRICSNSGTFPHTK